MKATIQPSVICGSLEAPSSKSVLQRLLVAAMLAEGESCLKFSSFCHDSEAVLNAIQILGASILHRSASQIVVRGEFNYHDKVNNSSNDQECIQVLCGESALALRMLSPIVALKSREAQILASGTLLHRPVGGVDDVLNMLGASCETANGLPPLLIRGPIHAGEITIDGKLSSQILTGLLMALPLCDGKSVVHVKNLVSRGYIDLTLEVLQKFSIKIFNEDFNKFTICGGQKYIPQNILVEGDWSAASVICVAAAVSGVITIRGLNFSSYQPDRQILEVMSRAGVKFEIVNHELTVFPSGINKFDFDSSDCPDLFPAMAVLAAFSNGVCVLKGARRLLYKESHRGVALQNEFKKLGIQIDLTEDEMIVHGISSKNKFPQIVGGEVHSHGDHRIAMALSILGLKSLKGVTVDQINCVDKSYPNFFQDLKTLRADIELKS